MGFGTLDKIITVVKVMAGACGFATRIKACKDGQRRVRLRVESECEAVAALGQILEMRGPLEIKDIVSTRLGENRVLKAVSETVRHAACPVAVALIKAAEVQLGLNVASPVTIEFESDAATLGFPTNAKQV